MELFFCALLLVFWFQETCCTQCGPLPSSSLPDSPTDVVGALPPDQRSSKLRRLFLEARRSARRPIRFTQLPAVVNNGSAVETTNEEEVVALRQNLDHQQKENAIAHELSHIVLQSKGFAAMVHTPDNTPPLMKELGFVITSCVDDAVVDRRMSRRGFKPELLNHDTAEQMRLHPPTYPANYFDNPIVKDGNALLIVCFSFRKRYRGDEIEPSWQKLSTDVVARAHILASQIGGIGFDDARTCLGRKKYIRDVLGYPITFCNPLTGEYE